MAAAGYQYAYAPGNKRLIRSNCCTTENQTGYNFPVANEEITFWSVTGQRMATYQLAPASYSGTARQWPAAVTAGSNAISVTNYSGGISVGQVVEGPGIPANTTVTAVAGSSVTMSANATASGSPVTLTFLSTSLQLVATQSGTWYYFGGKLVKNKNGPVGADRLGSVGKYYPYGQEKPSATTNGTEKFTGYLRDAETGLDYADQRYHSPGTGRFLTSDPYRANGGGNGDPRDPGSWNRYAYAGGDPVNHKDPTGQDWCWVGDYFDCLVTQPGANPGDFQISIAIQLTNLSIAIAALADSIANELETPDCTVKVSYRPVIVGGKDTGKNHLIITTITGGVQTVYEGEPDPSPAIPNSVCVPVGNTACPTDSLLVGETSPNGQKGLGTPYKTFTDAGWDCVSIFAANARYNTHPLHYVDNGAPNSNSYAYTLLKFAGLLSDVGLPPANVPGWGYDVIANPLGLP